MSRTYILLTIVAILGAAVLVFLPEKKNQKELDPEKLLMEINNSSRYLSTDLVAHRLIEKDPSILLVDVRPAAQYGEYALPGAINIPLEQVLLIDNEGYLNRNDLEIVLYSNGDLWADQAWILCARRGYKNLYVLKGGLNHWFESIMQPKSPSPGSPSQDFDMYSFRLAASQYFGGGANIETNTENSTENVIIKRREKKSVTAGGC
ncbi:MAG: rhodanese-like domain-containing protein [Bacteroidales bacterium]|nr:rhodanese-like domain-containing protein [Bacteroidales bacterium]